MLNVEDMFTDIAQKAQIKDNTGWIDATGTKGSEVMYKRKNGWVYVKVGSATSDIPATTVTPVFTLPSGFRPGTTKTLVIGSDAAGGTARVTGTIRDGKNVCVYISEKTRYFNLWAAFPVG